MTNQAVIINYKIQIQKLINKLKLQIKKLAGKIINLTIKLILNNN